MVGRVRLKEPVRLEALLPVAAAYEGGASDMSCRVDIVDKVDEDVDSEA